MDNRTIITALSSLVKDNHRSWDTQLAKIQWVMNNSVNITTNFTPSFLVYGRELISCGSIYTECDLDHITFAPRDEYVDNIALVSTLYPKVEYNIKKAHNTNTRHYNKKHNNKEYCVGDIVWRRNFPCSNAANYFSAKLAPRFVKCTVIEKISPLIYILKDPNGFCAKWHIKDFK